MGHRLSKIYTRTGDAGSTGLGDGSRVDKDDPRIEAIGAVDELNSALGMVLAQPIPPALRPALERIQHELFDLGGELSIPGHQLIGDANVTTLEQTLDTLNKDLPPLADFILPGGGPATAACHLARAVCRRAERQVVRLGREQTLAPSTQAYLNRLSDLLFVVARTLARTENGGEVLWRREEARAKG